MNKSAALFLILTTMVVSCIVNIQPANALANQWVEKAPMPTARSCLGAVAVNGTIYAIGGITKVFSAQKGVHTGTTNVNEAYDAVTDIWVEKTPMPGPHWLDNFGIAVCQGKIYCIGGPANNVYDPATDTWEAKAPMPTSRHFLQANVVDGKIYLISGLALEPTPWQNKLVNDPSLKMISYSFSTKNEVYDPVTDSWIEKAPLPQSVAFYSSAVVNNKIYVISGSTRDGITGLVQVYDPQTDNWTLATPISTPVEYAAAGAISNNEQSAIYVIGGYTQRLGFTNRTNANQVYFPENDSWAMSVPMPANRTSFSVVAVDNVLYAIGGVDETFQYSPELSTTAPIVQPSQSPTPSASGEPTASASDEPTATPQPESTSQPSTEVGAAVGATVATVVISAVVLLWKKPSSKVKFTRSPKQAQ